MGATLVAIILEHPVPIAVLAGGLAVAAWDRWVSPIDLDAVADLLSPRRRRQRAVQREMAALRLEDQATRARLDTVVRISDHRGRKDVA